MSSEHIALAVDFLMALETGNRDVALDRWEKIKQLPDLEPQFREIAELEKL